MESFTNGIKSAQGGVDTVFDDFNYLKLKFKIFFQEEVDSLNVFLLL